MATYPRLNARLNRNVKTAGGTNIYLHWYFGNANISKLPNFEAVKRAHLIQQKNSYEAKMLKQVSGPPDKDLKMQLKLLHDGIVDLSQEDLTDYLDSATKNALSTATAASNAGNGDLSFQQISTPTAKYRSDMASNERSPGSVSSADIQQDLDAVRAAIIQQSKDLTTSLGNYIDQVQEYLNQLIQAVALSVGPSVSGQLADLANNIQDEQKKADEYELCQKYINSGTKVYQITDSNNPLKDYNKQIGQIERISGLLLSLRYIQSGKISATSGPTLTATFSHSSSKKTMYNNEDLIGTILGKIGGDLSDANGSFQEIVDLKGLEAGLTEGSNALYKAVSNSWIGQNTTLADSGLFNVTTKVGDNLRLQSVSTPVSGVYGKGDSQISIERDGVTFSFGINTKYSRATSFKGQSNIKLHDSTNLNVLLTQLVNQTSITWYTILNVSAAHTSDYPKTESNGMGLVTTWRNIVDYATVLFFSRAIGADNGNRLSNFVLTYNHNVYWIDDIFNKLLESDNYKAIKGASGDNSKIRTRDVFVAQNQAVSSTLRNGSTRDDIKSPQAARKRSRESVARLFNEYSRQKVLITLDLHKLGMFAK